MNSTLLSPFHSECVEYKLIAIIINTGKSIYFLLRNGDPSFRVFLNFCDSLADRSDARGLWRRVLHDEVESKYGRGRMEVDRSDAGIFECL